MKFIIQTTLTIFFLSLIFFACKSEHQNPVLSFDKDLIVTGDIPFETGYSGKICLRNSGTGTLKITHIETSCSCTYAALTKDKIEQGDSLYINFSIKPNVPGFFQQNIIIENNTPKNPVMFVIRGKVLSKK